MSYSRFVIRRSVCEGNISFATNVHIDLEIKMEGSMLIALSIHRILVSLSLSHNRWAWTKIEDARAALYKGCFRYNDKILVTPIQIDSSLFDEFSEWLRYATKTSERQYKASPFSVSFSHMYRSSIVISELYPPTDLTA